MQRCQSMFHIQNDEVTGQVIIFFLQIVPRSLYTAKYLQLQCVYFGASIEKMRSCKNDMQQNTHCSLTF